MGARNPDRIGVADRYRHGATVALMIANGWEVISVCRSCGLQMSVRLDWIARINGPQTRLWNRKARCRRLLCQGVTEFWGKAPGMTGHDPLTINDRLSP
jgi:hypothetical protein